MAVPIPVTGPGLCLWGQAQAEVDHPDLVAILEAGRDQDGVYIIQEKVEGTTLGRLLSTLRKSRRTLTPANALLIAERLASAYRIAAGGSPAMDPKFPCLSIRRERMFHSWAMRTNVG